MRPRYNGKNGIRSFRKKGCHYMLLIPLLLAFQGVQAQNQSPVITHTVNFDQSALQMTNIIGADDHWYSKVKYQDLENTTDNPHDAGTPSLPVRYVHLIVPRDRNYSRIIVEPGVASSIDLNQEVYPVQRPVPTAEDPVYVPFAAPNPEIYQADAPFPSVLVKYVGEGYFDGNKHVITLAVYPVQYVPNAHRLDFYQSITFRVEENPDVPVTMHSLTRGAVRRQELYDAPLQQKVDNPGDIAQFGPGGVITIPANPYPTGPDEPGHGTGGKFKYYEYVIITSKELMPAFEELLGWKRRKGLNAGIVDIQDILSDPAYSTGDQISGINDDAGKLRQYLYDAYLNGTVYAVLGGDPSVIPIRYAAGDNNSGAGDATIPSDLYYTDFNGDWDVDGDPYYGESWGEDNVDYNPEIYVGRMLVKTQAQAVNHIHNVIRYERNPGRGDNGYVAKAFMTQADQIVDNDEAGLVSAQMTFYSPGNISIWDELPSGSAPNYSGPNASAVVAEITKHYGLVSIMGHGSPNNIAVATSGYNDCNNPYPKQKVTFLDAVNGWCAPTQAGNGLDNLDDFDHVPHPYHNYPHLFYTNACETIPYDDWLRNPGDADMGIVYSNYYKGGTAAYMGNTRYGWVWTSSVMYAEFAKQIAQGNYHIGIAEGLSKDAFFSGWGWCEKTHSLIGCPETEIWTKKPASFSNASVVGAGGTITVNTGGVTDATICIMSALDNGWSYNQLVQGATTYTFTGVPADYAVCITKHNYIPFLWNKNVFVQNHDFYGTAYVASPNDISSGQNVDKAQATGPVTVKSGGNVYFHADGTGTILLDRGFEVEPDAAFEAK